MDIRFSPSLPDASLDTAQVPACVAAFAFSTPTLPLSLLLPLLP